MSVWRKHAPSAVQAADGTVERRALGLLLEGLVINQVQVDPEEYRRFRSAILRNSIRVTEPNSESDLLNTVADIVREFEVYRLASEAAVEERQKQWRRLSGLLLRLMGVLYKIDPKSEAWTNLATELVAAVSAEDIEVLHEKFTTLFPLNSDGTAASARQWTEEQDRSTANDNAAGLRGGGAAIEHVRRMILESRPGHIGLFRLSCLDVVGERFGAEGIQDCLMAVSAFLIENLRAEDTVYHWSESSLLAVCDRKVREDILIAELNRVLARNRDFNINIGDRTIMLRIPIDMQLFPVSYFSSADDLRQLPVARTRTDRALSERASVSVRSLR